MLQRCLNPSNPNFYHYGIRPIEGHWVHPEWSGSWEHTHKEEPLCWLNYVQHFELSMGRKIRPEDTVHRLSSNHGYIPTNIVWACKQVQAIEKCPPKQQSTFPLHRTLPLLPTPRHLEFFFRKILLNTKPSKTQRKIQRRLLKLGMLKPVLKSFELQQT
eukprot:Lithocolla_globosa_v1_NODE_378_length_4234_cov_4.842344.p3 type:complete len:159 gc:universal NODE_378_length_4234_cov_4.842344:1025-1501(+)